MNSNQRTRALRTFSLAFSSLLVLATIAGPIAAQEQDGKDQSSLRHARKTFATADGDMNGMLSVKEATVAGIPNREFLVRDLDKGGSWSREEFLLYYHDLLVNSGKKPDAEFVAEVERIVTVRVAAMKRAQEAEELRRRAQERLRDRAKAKGSNESATAGEGGGVESISQKLQRAREALKKRSERADSSRDAYENTAGELAERARAAAGDGQADDEASSDDWAVKLRRARAALEQRAKDGHWSREQLQAADRRLIERARAAEQGVDLTALPASVRSKYERALVALSDRAKEGNWSREKYEAELADILDRAKAELNAQNGDEPSSGEGSSGGETSQARRDYERALVALDERAKAGGWTRERYEAERAELALRVGIKASNDEGESSEQGSDSGERAAQARAKLERAEGALEDRARRADMDREQHQRALEELYERARGLMNTELVGASGDVRTKYERAMAALIARAQRANMTRGAFEAERDQLLERAKQELASGSSGTDPAKKELVTEQLFERARAALQPVIKGAKPDVRAKYERALAALITRAQKAKMTRSAFESERDQLMVRARQEVGAGADSDAEAKGTVKKPGVRARRVETAKPLEREGTPATGGTGAVRDGRGV